MSTASHVHADDLTGLVREIFERELPRDTTRHRLSTETFSPRVWKTAASSGWFQVLLSEAAGGMGGGTAELAALMVESGRFLACGPWFETLVAGRLRDRIDLAPDDAVVTLITPASPFAEYADTSHHIIVVSDVVAVLDPRAPHVHIRPVERFDLASRPCRIEFDEAAGEVALRGDSAAEFAAEVRALALVATAARLLGVVEEIRDMSVQYAKDRVQFDHPIGSFQAVQQRLADMAVLAATTRSACEAMLETDDITELAALKGLVSANARKVVESALQVHGGVGFTDEHRLHLYFKHALRLQATWGSDVNQSITMGARLIRA